MQTVEQLRPHEQVLAPDDTHSHAAQLHELIARAVPITGTPGDHEMRERVLCRSGLGLVHAAPSPDAASGRNIVRFITVSGEEARDNKHLHVEGIDFRAWDETPVIPWCHQYDKPTLGRGLWRATYKRGGTHELWTDVEFMPEDLADDPWVRFAAAVGKMYAGGWMRGISAGWIPKQIREIRSKSGRLLKLASVTSEFIEQSPCPIPVDRWALSEAKDRSIITSDDVETIGRSANWRELNESVAYELTPRGLTTAPDNRGEIDVKREALTRAFKPTETRELVDERTLDPDAKLGTMERPDAVAPMAPMAAAHAVRAHDDAPDAPDGVMADAPPEEGGTDEPVPATTDAEAPAADPAPDAVPDAPVTGAPGDAPADAPQDAAPSTEGAAPDDPDALAPDDPADAPVGAQADDAPGAVATASFETFLRGPVSDELDLAYDKMRGAVVSLVDASDMLWELTHAAYFSGRGVRAELGITRGGMGGEQPMDPSDPSSPISMEQLVRRQLNRIAGQTQTISDAGEMFLDAMNEASTDTVVEEAGVKVEAAAIADALEAAGMIDARAGKKIRNSRRENLGGVLKILRQAVKRLATVLSEKEKDKLQEDIEQAAVTEPEGEPDVAPIITGLPSLVERAARMEHKRSGAEARASRVSTLGERAARFLEKDDTPAVVVETEPAPEPAPTARVKRAMPTGPLPGVAVPTRKLGDEFASLIGTRLGELRGGAVQTK